MKDGSKSKMASGSKDVCGDSTGKKNNEGEKTKNKDVTFIVRETHDVQKESLETNDLQITKRKWEEIDYIITKRRYLKYNKDAEANDMIHMGSDHRCVMATLD